MTDQRADRRKHFRRPVFIQCRVEEGPTQATMWLTDLSERGGFVDTLAELPIGSRVRLNVMFSGTEVPLSGRVVHVQPGRGFGIAVDVDDLPEWGRQRLEELLTRPR